MTPLNGSTRAAALLLSVISLTFGQSTVTLSKEYIHLGGQVIAIENAVPAVPRVSPSSLSFASQTVGSSSSAQTVTLSNSGSAALTVTGVSTGTADFSASNNCGGSVTPGGSCQINVTFTPQAAGTRLDTLSISDNSSSGSTQTVSLSGTGASASGGGGNTPTVLSTYIGSYGAAAPTYTAEPTVTVPFRIYLPSGISTFTNVTISMNAAGGGGYYLYLALSGSTYNLYMTAQAGGSGGGSGYFPLTPNGQTVATTVAVGSFQISNASLAFAGNELQLNLSLTQGGALSGYTMAMLADASGNYSFPGAGATAATWTPSSGPPLSWTPSATPSAPFTYAGTDVGWVSAGQTFTLTNSGNAAVSINSIAMVGANPDDFSIRSDECPASLGAGASCPVTVDFEPSAAGSRTATLQVVNSAVGSPETVALTGTGDGSGSTPSAVTTYMGVWGDPLPAYNGSTVMLPIRLYCPGGAATFNFMQLNLNAASGGGFYIYLTPNGATYNLYMSGQLPANGGGAPYPYFQLSPNGQTVATGFGVGALQVESASLVWVGNELRLDLTLLQSGAISYQVGLLGEANSVYSAPGSGTTAATWGN